MGIKSFHYHARKANAFQNVALVEHLDDKDIDMVFIDFNCVFFSFLQLSIAEAQLRLDMHIKKSKYIQYCILSPVDILFF